MFGFDHICIAVRVIHSHSQISSNPSVIGIEPDRLVVVGKRALPCSHIYIYCSLSPLIVGSIESFWGGQSMDNSTQLKLQLREASEAEIASRIRRSAM